MSTRPSSNIRSIAALLLLAALAISPAFAGSQGPNSPSAAANDASVGSVSWTDPEKSEVNDGLYSTAVLDDSSYIILSNYLMVTGFGFSIPSAAEIQGILVEVKRKSDGAATVSDNAVRIVKGGGIGATDKSVGAWNPADDYYSYGSSSELWGETWTAADINSSSFGFAFSAKKQSFSGVTAFVDHIRITVYYDPPPPTSLRNAVLKGAVIR